MQKKLCVLQVTPFETNADHVKYFENKQNCDFFFVTHDGPNKDALKYVIKSKLQEYSDLTHANSEVAVLRINELMKKYEVEDLKEFNQKTSGSIISLQEQTYFYTYILLIIILLFLVIWWLLRNQKPLHTPLFIISVLVSLVVLFPVGQLPAHWGTNNFQ